MIILVLSIITIAIIILYNLWVYYGEQEEKFILKEQETVKYLKKLNDAKDRLSRLDTAEDVEMLNNKIVEKELYLKELRKNIKNKRNIKV